MGGNFLWPEMSSFHKVGAEVLELAFLCIQHIRKWKFQIAAIFPHVAFP